MRLSKIIQIRWIRGEEWTDTWGDTELAFRSFDSKQNPLLAIFHKGRLDSLALNTIWYYSDWTSWSRDKDKIAGNKIILRKLVSEEEKYLKKVRSTIAIVKREENINPTLFQRVKHAFLLMQYMFVTDLGSHLSNVIEERIKKLDITKEKAEGIKNYLLLQKIASTSQKEEYNLKKLAKLLNSIHGKTIPKNFDQLDQKLKRLLTQHHKKYCFVQYSGIDTKPYTLTEIFNRLKEVANSPKSLQILSDKQKNSKSNKLPDLSNENTGYFRLVKKYIYLDNLAADLYQHLFFLTTTLIKHKFGISYEDMTWYSFQELEQLVEKNIKISKTLMDKRKKYRVMVQIDEKIDFFYGREIFEKIQTILPKKQYTKINSITGNVACKGLAKGKVIIIKETKDIRKMKSGDILVAPNTRPEFVTAMIRAAAIITDWGGITSHAAIVSRELGIPCIVGTDIATQVLKDGDMVEVDANKGVVRIID